MFTGVIVRKTFVECLSYSALFLGIFLVLGTPGLILQRLMVYDIPYTYMTHLIFYILPECLQFLIPVSLMVGFIVTFARMGADNEILALKSMGIQPIRILYPLLILCFFISIGTWYVSDISAICRERGIRNILLNGADEIVYNILRYKGEINSDKLRVKVDQVVGDKLINVVINYNGGVDDTPLNITAQEAKITIDKQHNELQIELNNGGFRHQDSSATGNFPQESIPLPIDAFLPQDSASSLTNATMPDIFKGVIELRKSIKKHKQILANKTSVLLLTGDFNAFNDASYWSTRETLQREEDLLKKTLIEPYRRFTLGFTCLCLVMIAAPLAIQNSKREIITNVILCVAPTLALFAASFSVGLNLGKQGVLPPWGICMADVVLFIIGLGLILYTANK